MDSTDRESKSPLTYPSSSASEKCWRGVFETWEEEAGDKLHGTWIRCRPIWQDVFCLFSSPRAPWTSRALVWPPYAPALQPSHGFPLPPEELLTLASRPLLAHLSSLLCLPSVPPSLSSVSEPGTPSDLFSGPCDAVHPSRPLLPAQRLPNGESEMISQSKRTGHSITLHLTVILLTSSNYVKGNILIWC